MGMTKDNIALAEALWREHASSLHRMLLSYEADRSLREDLAQNVFLALLQSIERVKSADHPKAYLFRIAHNVAIDHITRESRHRWDELDDELADKVSDLSLSPAEQTERSNDSSRLMNAVRNLKLPLKQVVTLLLEDFDQDEIAGILKISPGNVRVRLNRAKQVLEEALRHEQ